MNSGKQAIRWGIIGCGDVTERKSGPGFQKATGAQLVAVMRRNGELAQDYARRHNVPKWYDNADALINDPDVDAIYVATPPSTHKEYTLKATAAGKPVYVEKPMALNYSECLEMVECCGKANVPLFVAYYRRALPRFVAIKSLLDEKAIGDVRAVKVSFFQKPSAADINRTPNWRVDPSVAGAGYFFDLASHTLDLLQHYFGPITDASGSASNQAGYYAAEDTVSASWAFENGILGTGLWCFCAGESVDLVEIIGSTGKISFPTFADLPVIVERGEAIEQLIIQHPEHVQQPLIQLITNELLGFGKSPSTGKSGAQTNLVMDRILGRRFDK